MPPPYNHSPPAYCTVDVAPPGSAPREYAARGGKAGRDYPWGNALLTGTGDSARHRANIWQGEFPWNNTAADGFMWTSPVNAFGPQNGFGLYQVRGQEAAGGLRGVSLLAARPLLFSRRSPEMSGNGPLTRGALHADRCGKVTGAWRQSALGVAASPTPRSLVSRSAWRVCDGCPLNELCRSLLHRRRGCHETWRLLHVPPRLVLPLPHRRPSFQLARHLGLQHRSALLLRLRQAAEPA